jgi:hypothetical protein
MCGRIQLWVSVMFRRAATKQTRNGLPIDAFGVLTNGVEIDAINTIGSRSLQQQHRAGVNMTSTDSRAPATA